MHPLIKRIKRMQYIMEKGRSDLEFFGTLFCTDCVYYSSNGIGYKSPRQLHCRKFF